MCFSALLNLYTISCQNPCWKRLKARKKKWTPRNKTSPFDHFLFSQILCGNPLAPFQSNSTYQKTRFESLWFFVAESASGSFVSSQLFENKEGWWFFVFVLLCGHKVTEYLFSVTIDKCWISVNVKLAARTRHTEEIVRTYSFMDSNSVEFV